MPGEQYRAPDRIEGPPGFDVDALLTRLSSAALREVPAYRRAVTRVSPLLFALVYLPHHLRNDATGGVMSLSDFHIAMCRAARRWVRQDIGARELRDGWIAPREAAKSTWGFLIRPLWATAHEHRRFPAMFSDTAPQVLTHFLSIKREMETNPLLRYDFPELCEPAKRRGRSELDTQINYLSSNGVAFMAKGVESSSLGAKSGNRRPDLILFDDVEPPEKRYSPEKKKARLGTITNAILPMNDRAVVEFFGTTTMRGSIMHDLVMSAVGVRTARWIVDEQIRPRYFPPIIENPDGSERSLWPQRWPLHELQARRHTRAYKMNMLNLPPSTEGGYWRDTDIRLDPRAVSADRVLVVDPAVTNNAKSDFSAFAVVGVELGPSGRRRVVVEYARALRATPEELRAQMSGILSANPTLRKVRVEANQGGELWPDVFAATIAKHPGVGLDLYRPEAGKPVRFAWALDQYQSGRAVHRRELPELVDQMLNYPKVEHDDLIDAVVAGMEFWLATPDGG